ncbi:E3 ubiquitin ligase BIG BROTHER-related-like [Zingiber officinale]|uniref:E3 ubiquitin ligase BIG BROTHER-related-like n=1 Tax=Zingiber officinale TaxID=94328 RepID=UPI001C4BB792|nr:E3 ubiquitin ligase BIG BROTHER-related-like [Zingiber officinale]XP_042390264.1 E3 ubiquitin ligase BIG BROTHER-related-like [Zingiber officinale]XP_042390265.1 E3 ubiquitin ligase BIG BROTHER-related-like [Zingiber officinale]XP_042390266.1 E3 ubiquitin ligase BIG BROTHER-related-like [Zingiber officinale]
MGENFGKKAAREQIFSNGDQNDDQNINHSCNVRYNSNRGSQVGFQGRYTYARAPVNYGGSKAIAGSSSSSSSTSSRCSKFFREQQNQTIPRGSTVEQNGRQGKIEDLIKVDRQVSLENLDSRTERRMDNSEDTLTITEHTEPSILQNIYTDINESRIDTSVQPHNQFYFINRDSSSSSIKDTATEYRNFNPATRNNSERLGSGTERWGLKGISCTSISDVLPSACTSSHVPQNRRVDTVRKRPSDAEISAARSKGITASSSGTYVVSNDNGAGSSSYRRDHLTHNRTSRIARNIPTARDDSFPVRIRRGYSEESQMRLPVHGDESAFPLRESFVYPRYTWSQFSVPEVQPESSSRSSHALHSPYRRPDLSNQASQIRFMPHLEDNTGGMLVSSLSLGDRDDYRRLGMGAVAEVLLALERAEQDDALTYEQLLLLETSLLFSGLNFSDRHRDMRMDIDNMSYEELLALEERMGTVSTALSEEQLLRCLKRSIYTTNHVACGITFCGDEDMRCSICQEEYVGEDEVGELPCDHRYHTACIEQWLRQKNWCPVCKSSAFPEHKTG